MRNDYFDDKRCDNCRYYYKRKSECRINPPIWDGNTARGNDNAVWPSVSNCDYCGSHKGIEEDRPNRLKDVPKNEIINMV